MNKIIELKGIKYKEIEPKTNDKICKDCEYFLNNGFCDLDECVCEGDTILAEHNNLYTGFSKSCALHLSGLDQATADLCYDVTFTDDIHRTYKVKIRDNDVVEYPCWSLGRLLELIPADVHFAIDTNSKESRSTILDFVYKCFIDIIYNQNGLYNITL